MGDLGTLGGANAAVPRWGCDCAGALFGVGLAGEPARGRLNVNGFGIVAGPGDLAGDCGRAAGGFGVVAGTGAEKTLDERAGAGAEKTLDEREGAGAEKTLDERAGVGALKTLLWNAVGRGAWEVDAFGGRDFVAGAAGGAAVKGAFITDS